MTEKLNLADLKAKSPKDLLSMAEELEIENASTMRKGEIMFQILRERADEGWTIFGDGVLEVLQDGFGFLRSPEANYLPGPDDIYVSPEMIRKFSLRTGDTIDGEMKAPEDNERYFALLNCTQINFQEPERARHKIAFDNLTPLYPDERLNMEIEDPTITHRRTTPDGQNCFVAEHCELHRTQPSGMLPDRSPDRRAARRGHRHAALGQGRGRFLHL